MSKLSEAAEEIRKTVKVKNIISIKSLVGTDTVKWKEIEKQLLEKIENLEFKAKAEESDLMWDKLFNIKYRADLLYRNGNTDEQQMQENVRHKDSKVEVSLNFKSPETDTAKCGHLIAYTAYADSDGCVLCDKHMIEDLTNNG